MMGVIRKAHTSIQEFHLEARDNQSMRGILKGSRRKWRSMETTSKKRWKRTMGNYEEDEDNGDDENHDAIMILPFIRHLFTNQTFHLEP
jgi:hypothetical protein